MKTSRYLLILLLSILIIGGSVPLWAEYSEYNNSIALNGSYNASYNGGALDPNIGFGAAYRFWGIFNLNLNIYSDIVGGGDNIFNLERIEALGLFSMGWGLRIPMGPGFAVTGDLQRFYRGIGGEKVFVFSDSWKVGVNVELNSFCGLEFYTRRFFDFTNEAQIEADSLVRDLSEGGVVDMMGVSLLFYL